MPSAETIQEQLSAAISGQGSQIRRRTAKGKILRRGSLFGNSEFCQECVYGSIRADLETINQC